MSNIPNITKNLLIINVLAFLAMQVLGRMGVANLNSLFGLHFFMASQFHVYQLVTYMFMHGGWEHIILNMFMLWMFGALLERVWGPKRFLIYYFVCGIGAGVLQEIAQFFWIYYQFNEQQPLGLMETFGVMQQMSVQLNGLTTVGASGAIYACLLAFGMLFPEERMFIIPIPIPIKAKWMVMGSIVVELFSALSMPGDQVAHLAHLGGMLFGFFLIRYWRRQASGYQMIGSHLFGQMKQRWEQRNGGFKASRGGKASSSTGNPDWDYNARRQATQEEIDRILDKIRKSGYDSLSKEEKQTLFDQSKK